MTDKKREDIIEDLEPEELKVEKAKLKKEGDEENLKKVEEEEWELTQENALKGEEIAETQEKINDALKTEDQEEGLPKGEEAEDPYDSEEREDLVEDDELEAQEAGFLEGYERDSEEPKKKQPLSDEERLEE